MTERMNQAANEPMTSEPMTGPTGTGTGRRRGNATGTATGGQGGAMGADERIAELESRLQRLERAPGLRERGRSMMDRVIPPEATGHFRNAGREQLLGVRSIVDFWIQRLDEADERAARGSRASRERETIEIE
jgi:hypothetical protein